VIDYITNYSQSRLIRRASLVLVFGDDMNELSAIKRELSREPLKVLAISGSLRSSSFSTAIVQAMSYEEHAGMTVSVKTLEEIPLYNEDLDTEPALPAIAKLRDEVRESDGVVIATPEYNHGIPGVLRNALDWASRPAFASCFRAKPVLIVTSAPGATGGVRAQCQLRETLVSMLAHIVPGREILLAGVEKRMRDSRFTDADTLRVLKRGLQALREEVLSRRDQEVGK
jgi:chromate reductase, NAD(P)H dehydrogenase (quinone)